MPTSVSLHVRVRVRVCVCVRVRVCVCVCLCVCVSVCVYRFQSTVLISMKKRCWNILLTSSLHLMRLWLSVGGRGRKREGHPWRDWQGRGGEGRGREEGGVVMDVVERLAPSHSPAPCCWHAVLVSDLMDAAVVEDVECCVQGSAMGSSLMHTHQHLAALPPPPLPSLPLPPRVP